MARRRPGLRTKEVTASFNSGVDAGGKDPKLVTDKLLRLENGVFPHLGAIAKRYGLQSVATATGATQMGALDDKVFLFDETPYLADSSGVSTVVETTNKAKVVDMSHEVRGVTTGTAYGSCIWYGNNLTVTWRQTATGPVTYEIQIKLFSSTGRLISTVTESAIAAAGSAPSVCDDSAGNVYVFHANDAGLIKYWKSDGSSIASEVTLSNLTPTPLTGSQTDCVYLGATSNKIAICYTEAASLHPQVCVIQLSNGAVQAEYEPPAAVPTPCYSNTVFRWNHASITGGFCFIYIDDDGGGAGTDVVYSVILDETCTVQFSAPDSVNINRTEQVCGVQTSTSVGSGWIFVNATTAANSRPYVVNVKITATGTPEAGGTHSFGATQTAAFGSTLISKPLYDSNDDIYLPLYYQGGTWWGTPLYTSADKVSPQRHYFLSQFDPVARDDYVVGRVIPGLAGQSFSDFGPWGGSSLSNYNLPVPPLHSAGASETWTFPALYFTDQNTSSACKISVDLSPAKIRTSEANGTVYIPGSLPMEFDGANVVEQGFLAYPEGLALTTGAAGTWTVTGDLGARVVYEWISADGVKHQSAPSESILLTVTSALNEDFQIDAPTYPLWAKKQNVQAVLFLTELNGDTYYRSESIDAQANNNYASFTSITGPPTLYVAIGNDVVAAEEVLYTYGGIIENIQPPPHRVSALHHNRYFCVDRMYEDSSISYSRELFPGRGTPYTDFLKIPVNPAGGRITALQSFNEKLVIFKSSSIYISHGRGPSDTGSGVGFDRPRLVTSAVGAVNTAIAHTPNGLMFVSKSGIYLLGNDESIKFVGHSVRRYTQAAWNGTTSSIESAIVVPDTSHVVFINSAGDALSYNYIYDQWGEFSGGYNSLTQGVSLNGVLYALSGADLKYEDNTSYLDGTSTSYSLNVETGWLSFAKVLGYMRVYGFRLLGDNISSHKLRIKTAYDLDPHWVDDQVFDPSDLETWDYTAQLGTMSDDKRIDNTYKLEVHGSRQKVDSIRISIVDEDSGSTSRGQALALTALSFLVGVKRGLTRLGDDRRMED